MAVGAAIVAFGAFWTIREPIDDGSGSYDMTSISIITAGAMLAFTGSLFTIRGARERRRWDRANVEVGIGVGPGTLTLEGRF